MATYYTHGTPQVARDGRYVSYYRLDTWHTDDPRAAADNGTVERIHCVNARDNTKKQETYHSRCVPCWHGFPHTEALHWASMGAV